MNYFAISKAISYPRYPIFLHVLRFYQKVSFKFRWNYVNIGFMIFFNLDSRWVDWLIDLTVKTWVTLMDLVDTKHTSNDYIFFRENRIWFCAKTAIANVMVIELDYDWFAKMSNLANQLLNSAFWIYLF